MDLNIQPGCCEHNHLPVTEHCATVLSQSTRLSSCKDTNTHTLWLLVERRCVFGTPDPAEGLTRAPSAHCVNKPYCISVLDERSASILLRWKETQTDGKHTSFCPLCSMYITIDCVLCFNSACACVCVHVSASACVPVYACLCVCVCVCVCV